jgi:hypothetical protein
MHRWVSALLALAFLVTTSTQATQAQNINAPPGTGGTTAAGFAACQQLIFSTLRPVIESANRFNPGGIFPVGYWPLTQPFGSSPNETAYTGYPTSAYYSSYAVPGWAQQNPMLYPGAYPQNSVLPGLYPPDLTSQVGAEPNPTLTSAAILQRLQSDGTFDRLSPTEQADWLFRLSSLQRDEINQRFTQASLQQNAENTMLNLRRAPIDVSIALQNRASDWRNAYINYANTLSNITTNLCNASTTTAAGTAGAAVTTPVGGFSNLGACLSGLLPGQICR